jgi:hypothetical protein
MKYMLLIYAAENAWTDHDRTACMVESLGICDELAARRKYLAASPLQPVSTARTVRVRDGDTIVTDGPFAETTEQLGGYYLLDLEHLDEAIAVATRLPPVTKGTVEIRPLHPLAGLPPSRPPSPDGGDAPGKGKGAAYMLLCYDDKAAWREAGPEALNAAMAEAAALARELSNSGRHVGASPLHPPETATCVRVRDRTRTITDGPFAETNEVLGGYYVILAETVEEAVRVAARHPGARLGAVEVRPLFDLSVLGEIRGNSASPVDSRAGHSTR